MPDAETVQFEVALPPEGCGDAWVTVTRQPDGDGVIVAVSARHRPGETDELTLRAAAAACSAYADVVEAGQVDGRTH